MSLTSLRFTGIKIVVAAAVNVNRIYGRFPSWSSLAGSVGGAPPLTGDEKLSARAAGYVVGVRPLNSACALAAVGVLLAGCSTSTVAAPADGSQPSRSRSGGPSSAVAPRGRGPISVTSGLAPFTLPASVSRPVVYPRGAGLLVVGGLTSADRTSPAILSVDLRAGTVHPAGTLPVPVHDAGGAVVGGRDLLFGGGSTTVTSAVQDVTPGTSPRVVGHLLRPRADLVAISVGGAGYVLGGFDGAEGSATILRSRDGRTFTVVGSVAVPVRYPAVAVSAGAIWLFGGEHDGKQVNDVQRIDLATGRGSVAGHLPHPLSHAGAFTLGGVVFLAGGRSGPTATDAVLRFDPATVKLTDAGHLPAARSDFGIAVVAGTAYLVGGENPRPVNTVIEVHARAEAAQ